MCLQKRNRSQGKGSKKGRECIGYSNPKVNQYLIDTSCTDITQIERMIANSPNSAGYSFSIILKETNQLIGTCGLGPEENDSDWGFGYCFSPEYWGNGYATEVLKALIDFARSVGVKDLVGDYAIDNSASGKVMENAVYILIITVNLQKMMAV